MADGEQATGQTAQQAEPETTSQEAPLTLDAVKKLIQSETDRVRTEYSRKLKDVEAEKEELQKERMSEKERATYELEQQRKKNSETEAELARRELALERANIITEMAIPKDLAQFVAGKDRDDIMSNAKSLMTSFSAAVQREVQKKLAQNGPAPETGEETAPMNYDMTNWQKIWAMKPGPEKDAALERAFESTAGLSITGR